MLGEDKRRYERRSVTLRAVLRSGEDSEGPAVECTIRDISAGGTRVEIVETTAPVMNVILDIDRFGKYSVELVWARHPILGLSFRHSPELTSKLVAAILLHS
jgi:hypothetical protein